MQRQNRVLAFGSAAILTVAGLSSSYAQVRPQARAGAAANRPATSPSGLAVAVILQRIRAVLDTMDLTDQQKARIEPVMNEAHRQVEELARQVAAGMQPGQRASQAQAIIQNLRLRLAPILTPAEMQMLMQTLQLPDPNGANPALQEMRTNLDKLGLSYAQRMQIETIMQTARQKADQLRQAATEGQDVQDQISQFRDNLRTQISSVLTPDQATNLRQLMQATHENPTPADGRNMTGDMALPTEMQTGRASTDLPTAHATLPMPQPSGGPTIGQAAPDFSVTSLVGGPMNLAHFKGHTLVLEFGSLSCPVFRDHAADMEKLKSQFGSKADFMIVYTAEAYPADSWNVQRNQGDDIAVNNPTTSAGRLALATRARQTLKITIPVALDSMDNQVATTYGGFPNGTVVIDRNGILRAHQQWTNPDTLAEIIQDAINPADLPASAASITPPGGS